MATVSTGVTTYVDDRLTGLDKAPVWENTTTFPLIDGDTTGTATVLVNGLTQKVIVKVPNTSTDTQLSIVIKDNGDNTIFSAGPLAETATYAYSVSEPLSGEIDLALSFTDPDGTGSVVVTLRGV